MRINTGIILVIEYYKLKFDNRGLFGFGIYLSFDSCYLRFHLAPSPKKITRIVLSIIRVSIISDIFFI